MIPETTRNVTRIRLEAMGRSASEVEGELIRAAREIQPGTPLGDVVIERDNAEPDGSRTAWKGRGTMHPNTAELEQSGEILPRKVMILTEFGASHASVAEELVQDSFRHYETTHLVVAADSWAELPHATQLINEDEGQTLAMALTQRDLTL